MYNPWLEHNHHHHQGSRKRQQQNRQGGGVDNENFERTADAVSLRSKKSTRSGVVGGSVGGNERFYEEYEQERRVRKRRARLLNATEDAFTHIRRCNYDGDGNGGKENIDLK